MWWEYVLAVKYLRGTGAIPQGSEYGSRDIQLDVCFLVLRSVLETVVFLNPFHEPHMKVDRALSSYVRFSRVCHRSTTDLFFFRLVDLNCCDPLLLSNIPLLVVINNKRMRTYF